MTQHLKNKPYRKGVGIVLRNTEGRIWIGQRNDIANNFWQMPQGGIDLGETPETAILRELYEETCIQNVRILQRTRQWITYDFPPEIATRVYDGNYIGQKQIWFHAEFCGTDAEINIHNAPHPEFRNWKWETPHSVWRHVIPFKQQLYEDIFTEFRLGYSR